MGPSVLINGRWYKAASVDLDKIDPKGKRPWAGKNIFEKSAAVGYEDGYLGIFGGGSHNIHGNWEEIYGNHLHYDEKSDQFTPNVDWNYPRPQALFVLGLIICDALADYFMFMTEGENSEVFISKIDDLTERLLMANHMHEEYLQTKTWPFI